MKSSNIYIAVITTAVLLFSFSSCKKYIDVGENPNQIIDPPINSLLTTVTAKAGNNTFTVAEITSFFTQHLASPTVSGSSDTYQLTDYTEVWDSLYYTMGDINEMKKKAIAEGGTEHIGVSNLLMAYHLDIVIDLWGHGPYSEAFNEEIFTPRYDDPEALYISTLTLVNEGLAELGKPTDSTRVGLGSADVIYNGDKSRWIKFGNLLKARLLNKISKKASYDPAAVLAAVSLSFTGNADNARMGNYADNNPWANIASDNANLFLGGWLSEQFVDAMNGKTYGVVDPRITRITDPTVTGTYVGTPNGVGNVGPASNTVKDEVYISLNSPLTGRASPIYIATYAELKFIEAEAAFRLEGAGSARAYQAYLEGIRANMDLLGVNAADQATYLASPAVAASAATLNLDLIFKEKYIATYLSPEAWVDARRYDYQYKDFTLPANAAIPEFIRRVDYVDAEKSENGSNVPQITSLADRLWWDTP
ncbi:SusD/RagB family nutrient-binding outer membrane lipoprotein [Pedobacter immunditicola]|uniref:SusD/RagB family nutrient-binding outer membrane lipoprotein n=1 Tax=Pedobacter immunditicola TaxID=3133440 RepID=UPI0030A6961A